MSLRLRLLLAVGAIALVALVVADFTTYSALRTSLYNQVDQQLAQNRSHLFRTQEGLVFQGCLPQPNAVDGGADAVLAASIFHRREFTIGEAKAYMAAAGVTVRPA